MAEADAYVYLSKDFLAKIMEAKVPTPYERFLASEYGQRVYKIMIDYGMGEGDVDMILFNTFTTGFHLGIFGL